MALFAARAGAAAVVIGAYPVITPFVLVLSRLGARAMRGRRQRCGRGAESLLCRAASATAHALRIPTSFCSIATLLVYGSLPLGLLVGPTHFASVPAASDHQRGLVCSCWCAVRMLGLCRAYGGDPLSQGWRCLRLGPGAAASYLLAGRWGEAPLGPDRAFTTLFSVLTIPLLLVLFRLS